MNISDQRITFVQYSGDFLEAANRLAVGGKETYRAQRYTVDYVQDLARKGAIVTVVTGFTEKAYDVVLPSGVRTIGAGFTNAWDTKLALKLLDKTDPEKIILRTPKIGVLRGITKRQIPTLAMLADSLQVKSYRDRIKRLLTVHYLNSKTFERIGNHGLNAARQLVDAGVSDSKVFAWDFPPLDRPHDRPIKNRAVGKQILYVGILSADKGVDDLLRSVASVTGTGIDVNLQLVGHGESERLGQLAIGLAIQSRVEFLGRVPNDEIIARMQKADVVVVPSRHEYAEGMPLTIYEAFCSRTPLIVSDHPMFASNVVHEISGLVFRAGDSRDLADMVLRLLEDEELYGRLSAASQAAWERIQIPNTWAGMIDDWLLDRPTKSSISTAHS